MFIKHHKSFPINKSEEVYFKSEVTYCGKHSCSKINTGETKVARKVTCGRQNTTREIKELGTLKENVILKGGI